MSEPKDSHTEFIERLHSSFVTPREVINQAVVGAIRAEVTGTEKVIAGEANEVYFAQTDQAEVVVRIHRGDMEEFGREKWATEQVARVGVPVPRFLGLSSAKVDKQPVSICVLERVEGMPLDRMGMSFKDPRMKKLVSQAGEILAKIHSVKVKGYGRINADGEGRMKKWGDRLAWEMSKKTDWERVVKKYDGDVKIIDQAIERIREDGHLLEIAQACLVHGDYGPKHLMVKGGEIKAVIDWGNAEASSPFVDFAWWDYWFEGLPLEWLLEAYSDRSVADDPDFKQKLKVAELRLGLSLVGYYDEVGYKDGAKSSVAKLTELVKI